MGGPLSLLITLPYHSQKRGWPLITFYPSLSFALSFEYDASRDATAADCCLVVEVAEKSLATDRGKKLEMYARAEIPVYWVLNLRDRQLEVHTAADPAAGVYCNRVDVSPGQVVPVTIDGQFAGTIAVVDLLP